MGKSPSLVATWRGLSAAVSARLGRPIGVGRLRWLVETNALDVGTKLGNTLVFDESDVDAVVRLVESSRT